MENRTLNHKPQLFSIDKTLNYLNSLRKTENVIELGELKPISLRRNPLTLPFTQKKLEFKGRYSLLTPCDGRCIDGIFSYDSETEIGRLFIESGSIDSDCEETFAYENLDLRIRTPIELRRGVLPPSRIHISRITRDWELPKQTRQDYAKRLGIWIKEDFSWLLPSEYF